MTSVFTIALKVRPTRIFKQKLACRLGDGCLTTCFSTVNCCDRQNCDKNRVISRNCQTVGKIQTLRRNQLSFWHDLVEIVTMCNCKPVLSVRMSIQNCFWPHTRLSKIVERSSVDMIVQRIQIWIVGWPVFLLIV